jgi:hypothetical protein
MGAKGEVVVEEDGESAIEVTKRSRAAWKQLEGQCVLEVQTATCEVLLGYRLALWSKLRACR